MSRPGIPPDWWTPRQAAGGPADTSSSDIYGRDGERAHGSVGRWTAGRVGVLLDQVFDHPHPHAARLVIHLVAEFVDKQPDHIQTNRFIVELHLAMGLANGLLLLLLDGPRRNTPDLDLQSARPALE